MKSIQEIARQIDSTKTPREEDWKFVYNALLKNYIHQPSLGRQLVAMGHGTLIPVTFDGRKVFETTLLNDIVEPDYEFVPGEKNADIDGVPVTGNMPQIFETVRMTKDDLAMTFNGQQRLPIVLRQITDKIREKEDKIFFGGDSTKGVNGVISADSYDLGDPAGAWGVDTGSNGILDNMVTDVQKAIDYFAGIGIADPQIEMCTTTYIKTLMKTTVLPNRQGRMLDIIEGMLDGRVLASNNVQPSTAVTSVANSAVFFAKNAASFAYISSEIEQEQDKDGLWAWKYGARMKMSVKVLNDSKNSETSKYICWMNGISNATS